MGISRIGGYLIDFKWPKDDNSLSHSPSCGGRVPNVCGLFASLKSHCQANIRGTTSGPTSLGPDCEPASYIPAWSYAPYIAECCYQLCDVYSAYLVRVPFREMSVCLISVALG